MGGSGKGTQSVTLGHLATRGYRGQAGRHLFPNLAARASRLSGEGLEPWLTDLIEGGCPVYRSNDSRIDIDAKAVAYS